MSRVHFKKIQTSVVLNKPETYPKVDIVRVLVGSRAHGLATQNSDIDMRGIYVIPTQYFHMIGAQPPMVSWIEHGDSDDKDNTSFELQEFFKLAIQGHPNMLEALMGIPESDTETGRELKTLFPSIWSSKGVYESYTGYANNQIKKMGNQNEERFGKFGAQYIRTLLQGIHLLETGELKMEVPDAWKSIIIGIKNNKWREGMIIDCGNYLKNELQIAFKKNPDHETDHEIINQFLEQTRRNLWNDRLLAFEKLTRRIYGTDLPDLYGKN